MLYGRALLFLANYVYTFIAYTPRNYEFFFYKSALTVHLNFAPVAQTKSAPMIVLRLSETELRGSRVISYGLRDSFVVLCTKCSFYLRTVSSTVGDRKLLRRQR